MSKNVSEYFVDNYRIRFDGDLVCFNDLHAAAGSPENQEPRQWARLPDSVKIIDKLAENLHVEKSHIYKVSKARADRGGGTWGHKLLAVEYSGYLSPELRLKINDTFLRAESGDVTLAAEIADKASAKDQAWLSNRLKGIECRNELTSELSRHQVNGNGFGLCTDGTYKGLFGATAKEIRATRNLPAKVNVRNELDKDELGMIMFAEIATRKKLEKNGDVSGNKKCADFCFDIAQKISAIIAD